MVATAPGLQSGGGGVGGVGVGKGIRQLAPAAQVRQSGESDSLFEPRETRAEPTHCLS